MTITIKVLEDLFKREAMQLGYQFIGTSLDQANDRLHFVFCPIGRRSEQFYWTLSGYDVGRFTDIASWTNAVRNTLYKASRPKYKQTAEEKPVYVWVCHNCGMDYAYGDKKPLVGQAILAKDWILAETKEPPEEGSYMRPCRGCKILPAQLPNYVKKLSEI